jgi:hypothetical protein
MHGNGDRQRIVNRWGPTTATTITIAVRWQLMTTMTSNNDDD